MGIWGCTVKVFLVFHMFHIIIKNVEKYKAFLKLTDYGILFEWIHSMKMLSPNTLCHTESMNDLHKATSQ